MIARVIRLAASAALSFALAACGGGGGQADGRETVFMPSIQGNIVTTSRSLDLAIGGVGLFCFVDADGRLVFSRNGRLDVDRDGYLVHVEGWRLAGRPTTQAPADRAQMLPPLPMDMPGQASTTVTVKANLDSRRALLEAGGAFDPAMPGTYSDATELTLFDADGRGHWLTP